MTVHGPELVGRRFAAASKYEISANALESFAKAIGSQSGSIPPTFLISFAIKAAEEFLPTLEFDWSRVVHGDQRFVHDRQIQAGDLLSIASEIESYKSLAGNEFVGIRSDFFDARNGEKVSSAWSTLVFRGA